MADLPATAAAGTALAEQYEQLRQGRLDGRAEGWRRGLGVLTGRGMAAWMRAWISHPAPAPTPTPVSRPLQARPAPGTCASEVIAVLAQMTLAHT